MTIIERVTKIVNNVLKEMPSPELGYIIQTNYINTNTATVKLVDSGDIIEDVPTLGYPPINSQCLITYLNNDPNQPFAIFNAFSETDIAKAMGYGAFKVMDGHLFIELPEGMENPFSLNNGHLYIDNSKISDAETYSIKNNHVFRGETDLGECKGAIGNKGATGSKGATGDSGVSITKIELYDTDKIKITWSNGDIEVFDLWD